MRHFTTSAPLIIKFTRLFLGISIGLAITGCSQPDAKEVETNRGANPKTSYGQVVKRANDMSDRVENRDKEIQQEADELADEE